MILSRLARFTEKEELWWNPDINSMFCSLFRELSITRETLGKRVASPAMQNLNDARAIGCKSNQES